MKKSTTFITILILFMALFPSPRLMEANATAPTQKFLEDWHGMKFTFTITADDLWNLPNAYNVTVQIQITDMGGNEYLWLNRTKVSIGKIEEEPLVNRTLRRVGDIYSTTFTFKSDAASRFLETEKPSLYTLSIDIKGEVGGTLSGRSYKWSELTHESFNIAVYSYLSPIAISVWVTPNPIIYEAFELKATVTNAGNYPITEIRVELRPWSYYAEGLIGRVVGDTVQTLEKLEPKAKATLTFKLNATAFGLLKIMVRASYTSATGYAVTSYDFPYCCEDVRITVRRMQSTITCSASPEKITKGEEIKIAGTISQARIDSVTLTFYKPDETTMDKTTTSTVNGSFNYTFSPDMVGSWAVKASWGGDARYEGANSSLASFAVKEEAGCVIATSTYGSELAPEVQFLRAFRENVVLSTFAGSQFMKLFNTWYYSFSPSIAGFIANHPIVKPLMRGVLYPLIGILHLAVITHSTFGFNNEIGTIMAGLVASSLIGIVYFAPLTVIPLYGLKRKGQQPPKIKQIKPLLAPWAISILLIFLGELIASSLLMIIATGMFVVFTIALNAGTLALKLIKHFDSV